MVKYKSDHLMVSKSQSMSGFQTLPQPLTILEVEGHVFDFTKSCNYKSTSHCDKDEVVYRYNMFELI